jgi:hypothetical protein
MEPSCLEKTISVLSKLVDPVSEQDLMGFAGITRPGISV